MSRSPRKIILLGSGGLSIGQAGEFDYSGTQAVKALREEGLEVIVINPNIATVQTNPDLATRVYLYPIEPEWVEKVIIKEKPDGIIAGFGGQTALNCVLKLDEAGILEKYNVPNLGTSIETLRSTEDRELFAKKMRSIKIPIPSSTAVSSVNEALEAADLIGFPLIIRAAYTLGGLGSGFAHHPQELKTLVETALSNSPQVLLEKSLQGWKEVEYEVMRDRFGNAITICNMENLDPLGIHTGDSIVISPSQSLSDEDYQILRNAALTIVNAFEIVGECNVQFALDPHSSQFYVIEINARLSRSSALASKASGYPIAYIAAKVVLGNSLLDIKNPVTGITCAFYEPALDYVTVKIPRWDLIKFQGASRRLGSSMKSVGEVMAIGRTFPEALQKAARMVLDRAEGLSLHRSSLRNENLREKLKEPTDERLFVILEALRGSLDIETIHQLTAIDKWFLAQLREIVFTENEIIHLSKKDLSQRKSIQALLGNIRPQDWKYWKIMGFGDEQIASLILHDPSAKDLEQASLIVRHLRETAGIKPVIKKIDTTAAEYPSPSNYLYISYAGSFHDPIPNDKKTHSALILGGGAYRVGTSVEFDWCAVSCSKELQKAGWRSIIINCNPETVSTDYNSSDRLYFEELTLERILDIVEFENPNGAIVCMGGQLPNRLALSLHNAGIKLLGHKADAIDRAEDRSKFSALLDQLKIDQPRWTAAASKEEINKFIAEVGFPVLVRPSYVLAGAAMSVAYDQKSLEQHLLRAAQVSSDHPIVISEFLGDAREIEFDGVAEQGDTILGIISEHIENAGVHSGDATLVVPAQTLDIPTITDVHKAANRIAKELQLNGPFNIQFLAHHHQIKVIECNARAARTLPFVSKVSGFNFAEVATEVIIQDGLMQPIRKKNHSNPKLDYVGVKAAMFSFIRLGGADPILGVEMASTGEVGCLGRSFDEALLLSLQATGVHIPKKGVLVSAGPEHDKVKFLSAISILKNLCIPIYATVGTATYLAAHGYPVNQLAWPGEDKKDVLKAIRDGLVDLVINIPKNLEAQELAYGSQIRQMAIRHGCSLLTNMEKTIAFLQAMNKHQDLMIRHSVLSLPDWY